MVNSNSPLYTAFGLLAFGVAYCSCYAVYRLFLHPLARFPGPKMAALTHKYEFYYESILGGRFNKRLYELHKKYGPVVRLSPNQLHIYDPDFVDEIYAGGGKVRDRDSYFTDALGFPYSISNANSHERHQMLRRPLGRFFSKAAIAKIETVVVEKALKLCDQFLANSGNNTPIEITLAYSCMTTDIICQYCFDWCPDYLKSSSFKPNLRAPLQGLAFANPIMKQWPFLFPILIGVPPWFTDRVVPELSIWLRFEQDMLKLLDTVVARGEQSLDSKYPTIFEELLRSDLPAEEKTPKRLSHQAMTVVTAGTETTANMLGGTTFYLLNNPDALEKLQAELRENMPDATRLPSAASLENLPYFNAVVAEGLRLTYGITTNSPRVAREPVVYRGKNNDGSDVEWIIPPNCPVSMTLMHIHWDESIFPEPLRFNPDRWLDGEGKRHKRLDQYLMNFSRGSRNCLGMNLATSEIYIALAAIVLRVIDRMELFDTTKERDMEYDHCLPLLPAAKADSKGLRVLIR